MCPRAAAAGPPPEVSAASFRTIFRVGESAVRFFFAARMILDVKFNLLDGSPQTSWPRDKPALNMQQHSFGLLGNAKSP